MAELLLKWDQTGERAYHSGVEMGALFVQGTDGVYGDPVAWNGLTAVKSTPEGGEPQDFYADNQKYASLSTVEKEKGTIEAYTYPDAFAACDGSAELVKGVSVSGQRRVPFGFAHISYEGNDTAGQKAFRVLTILYGCLASPSERSHETMNADVNLTPMSWSYSCTPVDAGEGMNKTAKVTVNERGVTKDKFEKLLAKIYGTKDGTTETKGKLLTPQEIKTLVSE